MSYGGLSDAIGSLLYVLIFLAVVGFVALVVALIGGVWWLLTNINITWGGP